MEFFNWIEENWFLVAPFIFLPTFWAAIVLWRARKRSKLRSLVLEHLGVLAESQLPLATGLEAFADDAERSGASERDVARIRAIAERGAATGSLAQALKEVPGFVEPEVVEVIRIAEDRNALPSFLAALLATETRREGTSARLAQAFAYPFALLACMVSALSFLSLFIVPKFKAIMESTGGVVPDTSSPGLGISALVLSAELAFVGAAVLVRDTPRTRAARRLLAEASERLPLLGRAFRRLGHARWMERAASFIEGGVPLAEALASVATGLPRTRSACLRDAAASANAGEPATAWLPRALGKDAGELAPHVLLSLQAHGFARGLAESSRRVRASATSSLVVAGEVLNPLPTLACGAVVASMVFMIWGWLEAFKGVMCRTEMVWR